MLIEEKFIYISLPRCSSTSFFISCLKNNLLVQHLQERLNNEHLRFKNLDEIENEILADELTHSHEPLKPLQEKFGINLDVISVNRDRHERFISLWKHIIDEMFRVNEHQTYLKFTKLKIDDVLFFNSVDVLNKTNIFQIIDEFCERNDVTLTTYGKIMMQVLYRPYSDYHNHDPNIIWFDFKKLHELENWVSDKLNMNFKLEKINSSQHFQTEILNNDYFKTKYNLVYDKYDIIKYEKTFI